MWCSVKEQAIVDRVAMPAPGGALGALGTPGVQPKPRAAQDRSVGVWLVAVCAWTGLAALGGGGHVCTARAGQVGSGAAAGDARFICVISSAGVGTQVFLVAGQWLFLTAVLACVACDPKC